MNCVECVVCPYICVFHGAGRGTIHLRGSVITPHSSPLQTSALGHRGGLLSHALGAECSGPEALKCFHLCPAICPLIKRAVRWILQTFPHSILEATLLSAAAHIFLAAPGGLMPLPSQARVEGGPWTLDADSWL